MIKRHSADSKITDILCHCSSRLSMPIHDSGKGTPSDSSNQVGLLTARQFSALPFLCYALPTNALPSQLAA